MVSAVVIPTADSASHGKQHAQNDNVFHNLNSGFRATVVNPLRLLQCGTPCADSFAHRAVTFVAAACKRSSLRNSTDVANRALRQDAFQVVLQQAQESMQLRLLGGTEHSQDRV